MNTNLMEGDLRAWCVINPPREPTYYPVNDWQHAKKLITALADSQLMQPHVHSNAFGLEVCEDGEWCEWHNEEGLDIDDLTKGEEDSL